jgi:cytoskeletal protein CcmA (bactofilin family)
MGLLRKNTEPESNPANGPVLAPPPPRMQHVQPLPEARPEMRRPEPPTGGPQVALIDHGARIKGNLQFDTNVKIDGQIEGEIVGKQGIHIGENGRVVATIRASAVVVEGQVNGDIFASERIELCPTAKVLGNLTAPALVILEGAQYEGRCSMNLKADGKVGSGVSGGGLPVPPLGDFRSPQMPTDGDDDPPPFDEAG